MDDVSAIEAYEALKEIAAGKTINGDTNAKTVLRYFDKSRSANVSDMEKVFLTKEDKVQLIDRIDRHFVIMIGFLITILGTVVTFALIIINKLPH